jgi:hypothetical protein
MRRNGVRSTSAGNDKAASSGTHDISFLCDDIERTVAELEGRGVEFTEPVKDHDDGLDTQFKLPAVSQDLPFSRQPLNLRPKATRISTSS